MSGIWVIGGTSGIGQACAERCADRGHAVKATGHEIDVTHYHGLEGYWKFSGGFNGVIYSAGINELMWLHDMDVDKAAQIYAVNVLGFLNLLRIVSKREFGNKVSVVAISSDAAERPMRTSAAYCASKAALNAVVRCAARELAPYIRVNAVSPGMTSDTEMTRYIDDVVPTIRGWTPDKARRYEQSQIPMGRRALPMEVAEVVYATLVGPGYQTGSIITINGGR